MEMALPRNQEEMVKTVTYQLLKEMFTNLNLTLLCTTNIHSVATSVKIPNIGLHVHIQMSSSVFLLYNVFI